MYILTSMRIVLITLILSIFGFQAQAQKADPAIRAKVLAARAEAIQVIREYSENANYDAEMRKTAGLMADLLEKAGIIPAVGVSLKNCEKNVDMEANTGAISQVISLCHYGISSSENEIIQIFIHEAYHLYEGVYYLPEYNFEFYEKLRGDPGGTIWPQDLSDASEKRASKIELEIMQKTYGCVFSVTTYYKDLLGLKKGKDFFVCK